MKTVKLVYILLAVVILLVGCGMRTVICDGCGAEIQVRERSNITDEWILFCSECEKELDPIVSAD